MAVNSQLTKDWIKFLKNNQIVSLKSNPDGKLNYKRTVTTDDLIKFLRDNTHYSEDQINNAISMVAVRKGISDAPPKVQNNPTPKEPGKDLSTWMYHGMRPGEHPTKNIGSDDIVDPPRLSGKEAPKLRHDPNSVSDVDFREIPHEPKEPGRLPAPEPKQEPEKDTSSERKPRFRLRKVKEGIEDTAFDLDEKDVEQVFSLLSSEKQVAPGSEPLDLGPEEPQPTGKSDEQKQLEVDKIKQIIHNKMTDSQRKSLWRLLTDA